MEVHHYIFGFTIVFIGISISQSDKPSGLTQGIYCEGCIATVKELLKKVNKKTGESREVNVIEAMEDICNLQNFGSYEYSPPKTGQACRHLMETYDEEIEDILMDDSEDFENKICYELTEACKGVDRSKKEKEELEVNINNEKQKLQTGRVDKEPDKFHVDINEKGAAKKLVDQINMAIKDKKNVAGADGEKSGDSADSDDDDDDVDDDEDDEDDEEEAKNKLDEEAHMETVEGDDIENLADSLEDAKTEL